MATVPKKAKKGLSTGAIVGIGAGVLATAAASYFFFGPDGKKNRTKLKGWMIKMKGDVIHKMEQAKDLTEEAYHKIVDSAATAYAKEGVSKDMVTAFAATLKKQWKGFAKAKKSSAKKAVKKAVKKAAKKA